MAVLAAHSISEELCLSRAFYPVWHSDQHPRVSQEAMASLTISCTARICHYRSPRRGHPWDLLLSEYPFQSKDLFCRLCSSDHDGLLIWRITALLVLSLCQSLIDELLPDRVGLPDLGHRGAGGFQWHALPQHTVQEEEGRNPHICDTVDEPFFVLGSVHDLEKT